MTLHIETLQNILQATYQCYTPHFNYTNYQTSFLGIDTTNGRFAEVTIEICTTCQTKWIKYLVELEGISNSGRWYRGIITDEDIQKMTPEKVQGYLEKLDWYIYGGSYFNSTGKYGKGRVQVD